MKCSTCGGTNCSCGGKVKKPLPKLNKGGKTDMYAMKPDVPAMHGYDEGGKVSAPAQAPGQGSGMPASKNAKNNELDNAGGWSGAMKNVSKELGLAGGGEVDGISDEGPDEMNDMVAQEAMEAFEKKDAKGFVEALKALMMNMGDKS